LTVTPGTPSCSIFPNEAYYEFRIEGTFLQVLSFKKFPLDRHILNFQFEDVNYGSKFLIYVKDDIKNSFSSASGIKDGSELSGWNLEKFLECEQTKYYNSSNFNAAYSQTTYSNYRFEILISKGASFYILKVLPPVLFTVIISICVLLLDIDSMDVRLGTTAGGMLAEIFLQLSFETNLPNTDYLTLLDWVFDLTYLALLMIFFECIVLRKLYFQRIFEEEKLKSEKKLRKIKQEVNEVQEVTEKGELTDLPKEKTSHDAEFEAPESLYEMAYVERITKISKRIEKLKALSRTFEKYFFIVLMASYLVLVLITSIAAYFTPDPDEY